MSEATSEQSIFLRAIALATPQERSAYLDEVCRDRPTLRVELAALLAAHDRLGDGSLPRGTDGGEPETIADEPPDCSGETPGTVIGAYKLLEPLGEGGMGSVWMAQQQEPVKRLVAIKVIKAGMDSRQVIARFEAERQALALMDHPNIAKVLAAGTTETGRPYFVMDLVKGVPITRYCDEHRLTPRQRLELFLPVSAAVQHAHQKGIIHRDIKPSNVLVALYDGKAVPKVIDFGVAKATGPTLTEKTLVTGFGAIIGTLEYMSPEQAQINQLDIDTRSDVYSLGVLLYELLTGTTPLEHRRVKEAGLIEALRIIREEETPRPSTRLSTVAELPTIAANRGTEPKKLSALFRGEVDWIVMKALDKDRNRRYETPNGFAADVQRYLADEPVLACPPSVGYRLRKVVRRNWRVLTATLAFVLLLVTAVLALTVALVAANRERQDKEAALEAEGMRRKQARKAIDALSSHIIGDWLSSQPALLPEHKQFLEMALRSYEEFAEDTGQDEESRAGVAHAHYRVGFIREQLGQWKTAATAYERTREVLAGLVADFPDAPNYRMNLAEAHRKLGALYRQTGRAPEAEAPLRQSLSISRPLVAEFSGEPTYRRGLALTLDDLGIALKNLSRFKEAEEAYGEALGIHKKLAAEFPTQPRYSDTLAQTHMNLGTLLDIVQREPEAIESLEKSVDIYVQLVAANPTVPRYRNQLAVSRNNLGNVLRDARRYPEAERVFDQALTTRKELVAQFPTVPVYRRGLAMTLNNLGILLKNNDRAAEAEKLYGQSLDVHKKLAADFPKIPDHQNETAGAMVNLARLLLARKDFHGARQLLEEGVPYHQAALKANKSHPAYRNFYRLNRWRMAETLLELNEHAAAAEAVGQFLQMAVQPPRDSYTAACLLAGCVRLAAQDQRLTAGRRRETAATYGDSALAALRQAIEKGAKEVPQMAKDPSLDPLRSREDFQKLLAGWEARKKP